MARSSRRGRRFSRGMAGLLVVGLTVFGVFYFNRTGTTEAAPEQVADALDVGRPQPSVPAQAPVSARPLATNTQQPTRTGTNPIAGVFNPVANVTARPTANVPQATTAGASSLSGLGSPFAGDPAPRVAPRASFLADAEKLIAEDKLLDARTLLNDALQSGTLDRKTADAVKIRIADLSEVIVFSPRRFDTDPHLGGHTIASGENLIRIARPLDVPYELLSRVNNVQPNRIRAGQSIKTVRGPFHAVVSKKHFTMDLYLGGLPGTPGSVYVTTLRVGLGEDASTPTGLWQVTPGSKLKNPEWTNPRTNQVIAASDPLNPLGPRWIGLTGVKGNAVGQPSYGIHGTIEPHTIGTNASMGCVRLVNDDAEFVYDLLIEGKSTVLVTDD